MIDLVTGLNAYKVWRSELIEKLNAYRRWLNAQKLADPDFTLRIQQTMDCVDDYKLYVAFVAEFSRGKTELINALFFFRLRPLAAALQRGQHRHVPHRAVV
jgi:hypothetical protein